MKTTKFLLLVLKYTALGVMLGCTVFVGYAIAFSIVI